MCEKCESAKATNAKFCPECGETFTSPQPKQEAPKNNGMLVNSLNRSNADIRKERNKNVIQGIHRHAKVYMDTLYNKIESVRQKYEALYDLSPDTVTSLGVKNFNPEIIWNKALEIEEELFDLTEEFDIAQKAYTKAMGQPYIPQEIDIKL